MTTRLPVLLAVLLLLWSLPLYAQPSGDLSADEAIVRRGIELRREGKDAEALAEFQRALAIRSTSRTRAQIGLAQQALGRWIEAEASLVEALRAGEDPWIVRQREVLDAALGTVRRHLGWLEIATNVPSAELWVNGSRLGALPQAPLRVVAGAVALELRAAGYRTAERTVTVAPEEHARETVTLVALPPKDAPPASPPPAARRDIPLKDAVNNASGSRRTVAWIALAGGATLLGSAVVAHLIRESNAAEYNDDGKCLRPGTTRDENCGHFRDAVTLTETLAVVGYVAGGAALAVGAVLLTVSPSQPAARSTGSIDCRLGLMNVTCGGRW
jgi:hypothetical protein